MLSDTITYVDPTTGQLATASRSEIKARYSKPLPKYKYYSNCAEFWDDYLVSSKAYRKTEIGKMKEELSRRNLLNV